MLVIPRRLGGSESKLATVNTVFTSVSTAGAYASLVSNIAAGVDCNARIGRRIRVTRIGFQGTLIGGQTNSLADDPYNTVRLVIVKAVPGFTWNGGLSVNGFIDPRYHAGLFEVLYDKAMVLRATAKDSTGYVAAAKVVRFNIPMSAVFEYNGTGAAAPVGKEMRAYCVSDSSAVAHPGFATDSSFVIEFFDS